LLNVNRLLHACMRAGDGITEADGGKVQAGAGNSGELMQSQAQYGAAGRIIMELAGVLACMRMCVIHARSSVQRSFRSPGVSYATCPCRARVQA
jgi:hypothetical protein